MADSFGTVGNRLLSPLFRQGQKMTGAQAQESWACRRSPTLRATFGWAVERAD
jgi:hypothetical protein